MKPFTHMAIVLFLGHFVCPYFAVVLSVGNNRKWNDCPHLDKRARLFNYGRDRLYALE